MGRGDQDRMMRCATVQTPMREKTGKEPENPPEKTEEYKMLIGRCNDTREARNKWIDAVERSLEFEAFENGERHMDRGLGRVKSDGDYPMKDVPRWML